MAEFHSCFFMMADCPGIPDAEDIIMDTVLYALQETVQKQNYVIATYHISLPKEVDVVKKAATLAVGQTIGTWIRMSRVNWVWMSTSRGSTSERAGMSSTSS